MQQDHEHRIRRYINASFRQVSKPGLQQAQADQSGSLGAQYPGAHTQTTETFGHCRRRLGFAKTAFRPDPQENSAACGVLDVVDAGC